jgi:hypothetical protein
LCDEMKGAPDAAPPDTSTREEVLFSGSCALWKGRYPVPGTVTVTESLVRFAGSLGEHRREAAVGNVASWATQTTALATWLVIQLAQAEGEGESELSLLMTSASCAAVDAVLRRLREEQTLRNLAISEKISASPTAAAPVSTAASVNAWAGGKDDVSPAAFRLPEGQVLLERAEVWLYMTRLRSYRSGRLCLFSDFVGFWSENLWFVVALSAVTFALPAKTFVVMNNAMQLITNTASYFFVVAKDRDALLSVVTSAWKQARARSDVAPYPTVASRTNERPTRAESNQMQLMLFESYVAQWGSGVCMARSYPQLRFLCQSGLPDRHRAGMWQACSGALCKRVVEGDAYHRLLVETADFKSASTSDIDKDVRRSLPEHPLFQTEPGVASLRNVLRAYAFRNPVVGYTQGMNLLAAHLLLFMGEEDAFFLLCAVIEDLNPNVYRRSLVGALVEQQIFDEMVKTLYPRLAKHIATQGFDLSISTTSWWLCLFIGVLSHETVLVVLDAFFEEGNALLLRVGLALLSLSEEALFMARDVADFVSVLGSQSHVSAAEIFRVVNTIAVPLELLEQRRQHHTFEESKRLAEAAKKKEMAALSKRFKRFSYFEIENVYDYALSYCSQRDDAQRLEFLQFQRVLPHFFPGLDLETQWRFFNHCEEPGGRGMSLASVVGLLEVLQKGTLEEQFDFFWEMFVAEEEEALKKAEELSAKRFCNLVSCMVAVRFSLRTSRVVFHKSRQAVAKFCATMIGDAASIGRGECRDQLVVKHRMATYFKH